LRSKDENTSPRVGIGNAYTTTEQKFLGWLDSRKSVIVFKFGGKVGLKCFYKLLYFRSLTEFYDALKVRAPGFHMAELLFNLKPPSRSVRRFRPMC
jgi:hypothetical protein